MRGTRKGIAQYCCRIALITMAMKYAAAEYTSTDYLKYMVEKLKEGKEEPNAPKLSRKSSSSLVSKASPKYGTTEILNEGITVQNYPRISQPHVREGNPFGGSDAGTAGAAVIGPFNPTAAAAGTRIQMNRGRMHGLLLQNPRLNQALQSEDLKQALQSQQLQQALQTLQYNQQQMEAAANTDFPIVHLDNLHTLNVGGGGNQGYNQGEQNGAKDDAGNQQEGSNDQQGSGENEAQTGHDQYIRPYPYMGPFLMHHLPGPHDASNDNLPHQQQQFYPNQEQHNNEGHAILNGADPNSHDYPMHLTNLVTAHDAGLKKPVEPLFAAMAGFVGVAVIFMSAVIFLPKLLNPPPSVESLKKGPQELAALTKLAIDSMEGHDCTERIACEVSRAMRSMRVGSKPIKIMEIVLPLHMSKQLAQIRNALASKKKCTFIPCKRLNKDNNKKPWIKPWVKK